MEYSFIAITPSFILTLNGSIIKLIRRYPHGIVANTLDCNIIVCKFKLQSHYAPIPRFLRSNWYECQVGGVVLITWLQEGFLPGNTCLTGLSSLLVVWGVLKMGNANKVKHVLWQLYRILNSCTTSHYKMTLCQICPGWINIKLQ